MAWQRVTGGRAYLGIQKRDSWGKTLGRDLYAAEMKLIPVYAIFTVLVLAVIAGYHIDTSSSPTSSKAAAVKRTSQLVESPPTADPLAGLPADMNAAILASPSLSASATLINLETGKTYNAGNYSQSYTAASTAKLVAVFDYIHQVELGKASLSQNIQGQSAQDIIMRMIVYSDNDAWTKLNTYLHMPQEQKYVSSLGVLATIQTDNVRFSTPQMAKLLQLLYQGKLMNTAHQALVYEYMSHTTVKNLIQAALPADATVYHKYGQVEGVLHDAAIVQYQGHDFVLVVYTNNPAGVSTLKTQQVDLIHAVTTAAFADVTKS